MIDRYSRPAMKQVWSEENTFDLWLRIEIAATNAWAQLGVVPLDQAEKIAKASFDRAEYDRWFESTKHDIVSFTRSVTSTLGPEGRWLHHGLTSNDVKDTALSIQLTQSVDLIDNECVRLMSSLRSVAEKFALTPCMGRSHGIHAEPMSFGLKAALWWDEMQRHINRLKLLRSEVAVGMISGPVGTHASVPPKIEELVCRSLELKPSSVTNQVIQRDIHAHFVQTLALIAASLEKVATEIRSLQRTEIQEVEEPFGKPGFVSTGSSSMPHKRNPELCERICGLARLVRGNTIAALENVALWHERDISHSSAERMLLPDSSLAVDYMLDLLTRVISGMRVLPTNMLHNLELTRGSVFSERVMLGLVERGMDRQKAYELCQEHAMSALESSNDFRDMVRGDDRVKELIDQDDLESLFDYGYYLRYVNEIYARLGFDVQEPHVVTDT